MVLPFVLPHHLPPCGGIAFQIELGKFNNRMFPNIGGMNVIFHIHKPNIHNLSVSNPIKVPGLNVLEAHTFRRASFEGRNQLRVIGPIDLEQNLQLFRGEKDYGWLLLFIFMVTTNVMVLFTFKILLFLLSYGFRWNF